MIDATAKAALDALAEERDQLEQQMLSLSAVANSLLAERTEAERTNSLSEEQQKELTRGLTEARTGAMAVKEEQRRVWAEIDAIMHPPEEDEV